MIGIKRKNNILFRGLVLITTITSGIFGATASDYGVKISLDSASLLMGKQTTLHVEIMEPSKGHQGYLIIPSDTLTANVEIFKVSEPDTTFSSHDGPMLVRQEIILQSFDSGLYPIGPLAYVIKEGDTVFSNPLSLKVVPVDVDSLETIHSFAPVISIKSKWYDFLPDWLLDYWLYCIICIIVVAGGIFLWLMLKKKVAVPFMPKAKPISPYNAAISSLNILRDKHLCENGREKEYYTDLTDILRIYLEGRFGINAMEMTSSQILDTLKKNEEIRHHHDMVKRILEIADYVKFAKVRPLPDDNVKAWNDAHQFVIDTKPVETEKEEENIQESENRKSELKNQGSK